jgi:hypothetical protein
MSTVTKFKFSSLLGKDLPVRFKIKREAMLRIRIQDQLLFCPWIRDPEGKKIRILYPGSAMNIPDHISKSLVTIIWVKNA